MQRSDGAYIAIDLKSFYASVECAERGLNPLTTNLVVADESRTEKTICLAVTPALKAYGIPGRARLFEVIQKVREVNRERKRRSPGHMLGNKCCDSEELKNHPTYEMDFIIAPPRMAKYMEISSQIYGIYLKYVAPEDIHIYSIDEVFIDAAPYLPALGISAHEFARMMIADVLKSTGITATAGIGTNLYLSKIAMDIIAKHIPPDNDGVRVAELDEMSYRKRLWNHRPLTDFWRIGAGISTKLEQNGMFTMGDVARCSLDNEERLYKLFGVNAELLIDHAWGWESCTISDIKSYTPEISSISSGQVLQKPYSFEKGLLIVREMADLLSLDLVEKRLVTDQIVLNIGYDTENLLTGNMSDFCGEISSDHYGRSIPKPAHGSINLGCQTSSTKKIVNAAVELYRKIVRKNLSVRRINIVANRVVSEDSVSDGAAEQLDLFTDYKQVERENEALEREKEMQKAVIEIKRKFGKNAVLKGMNLEDGATTIERNGQVGGHRA